MSLFLKLFNTTAEYNTYTADTANFIKPNVSCTLDDLETVHYNPIKTRVVAKYNVTNTSSPTPIGYNQYTSGFSEIEIDGVVQPSVVSAYTFNTTGEHTVKYTLTDPTSIGNTTFSRCSGLTSIDIPNGVTSIGYGAFSLCRSLTSIDIPDSVTSIGGNAFSNCSNLTSIDIPDSVTSISSDTFNGCSSLTSCTIGSGVTTIGDYAFSLCSRLTSIDIPSGVTSIGENAFMNCSSLTSIDIPSGVTSIGKYAFSLCSSLTSIVIPSGVTTIGFAAFNGCISLTSATVNATTPPTLGEYAFINNASGRKIYVPSASVETYKSASGWNAYASDIEPIS